MSALFEVCFEKPDNAGPAKMPSALHIPAPQSIQAMSMEEAAAVAVAGISDDYAMPMDGYCWVRRVAGALGWKRYKVTPRMTYDAEEIPE